MTTVAPWLPLALLVVPTLAAVVVVLAGLFQLVFGRRQPAVVPRAVVVPAPAPVHVRVARGTAPPASRPELQFVQPAIAPAMSPRAELERASTVRAQPVRSSRPAFEDDEPTSFFVRQFAAR